MLKQTQVYRIVRRVALRILYFGFRYVCPNCGARLRNFRLHGFNNEAINNWKIVGAKREGSGKCPFCDSTERDRLVFAFLSEQQFETHTQVLHVAPEPLVRKFLSSQKEISYFPGDKFDRGYHYRDCLRIDITDLPFKNNLFDWVVCNHVLEHVIDVHKALDEIWRVLKENGRAILQVPISFLLEETLEVDGVVDPSKRLELYGQSDHVRLFGRDYPNILSSHSFKVAIIESSGAFLTKHQIYKLNPEEKLFIVTKCVE